ncbi:MAG: uL15 family ribosomal protein, partial [Candidatus Paceibacterales bacterium]
PFPYTQEALAHVARRVDQVQERLGRQLLVENLSSYLSFSHSEMTEGEFLAELTQRTGCGILFDVENLYVNGLINQTDSVKILGNGELKAKLSFKVNAVSAKAKAAIEAAGSTLEIVK